MTHSPHWKTAVLLTVSICLSILLLEFILRFQTIRRHLVTIQRMPTIYEADPDLGYRYRPSSSGRIIRFNEIDNLVTINSTRSHDVERDPDEVCKKRLVAVGDSFTACLEVPVESTWTRLLEVHLKDHVAPDAQVVNLGLDGTGTDIHLRILEQYLDRYAVDVVLLLFYENDLEDSLYSLSYRECYRQYVLLYQTHAQKESIIKKIEDSPYGALWVRSLYDLSYTFRLLLNLADPHNLLWNNLVTPVSLSPPPPPSKIPAGEHRLKEYMKTFMKLAEMHGFAFFVVPAPCRDDPRKSERVLREALAGDSSAEKIPIRDIIRPLQAVLMKDGKRYEDMFWVHDNHLNSYGNRVLAEALCKSLRETRFHGSTF